MRCEVAFVRAARAVDARRTAVVDRDGAFNEGPFIPLASVEDKIIDSDENPKNLTDSTEEK